MNQNDMNVREIKDGDVVNLSNTHEGTCRQANTFIAIAYPIPEGCTATYFPETNVLVPITSVALKSNTPTSKQVAIRVIKQVQNKQ